MKTCQLIKELKDVADRLDYEKMYFDKNNQDQTLQVVSECICQLRQLSEDVLTLRD